MKRDSTIVHVPFPEPTPGAGGGPDPAAAYRTPKKPPQGPVSHLVDAVRGLMGGDVDSSEIVWVLVASALLVAVFAPLTMKRYSNRT